MYVCDKPDCCRVFCMECISALVSPDYVKVIQNTDPWLCFLCEEESGSKRGNENRTGLLEARADWRATVIQLYQPTGAVQV